MGLQISCGIYPEMPQESVVWQDPEILGIGVSGVGCTAVKPDLRRAYGARARAHVDPHSAEIFGG